MQFTQDLSHRNYRISGYANNSISINGEQYLHSLLVMKDKVICKWPVQTLDDITPETLQLIIDLTPEIVIFGTGKTIQRLSPELLKPFSSAHIGIEIMDSHAACRTYNILLAEDRKVALAIIL